MKTECLIVGGGPAGLMAATNLGRFRRSVIVIDAGDSRALRIPTSHNLLAFPDGISGPQLLERMRIQCDEYGAKRYRGTVAGLNRVEGGFVADTDLGMIASNKVLLATGGLDVEPEVPALKLAVKEGAVRYCPICDAFEASGKRIGLISYGKCRVKEALLLHRYASQLTVLSAGQEMHLTEAEAALLHNIGARIVSEPIAQFHRTDFGVSAVTKSGDEHRFEILYCALGTRFRSNLAVGLGVPVDEDGAILPHDHLRTNVPGLFVAGDIVHGLSQIAVASAHAAIASTAINAELLEDEHGLP